nr:longitudinals lacking protein, isoforms H/M/V-like isoform X4 [Cherax quadricarinatus]
MDGGLLSLRWNDHRQTFFKMLSGVRKREAYCDVTLACDGRFYPVHKLVLSTCSDFFDEMFEKTACKHPVIVVANVAYKDLEALLNYMYLGEVNVLQNDLTGLMKAAEALRIKGLAEPVNAPSTKDIRESKRSSLWEDDLPDGKRKRSEEVPPTATTDNDRTGRREMQKSRITSNDSETSRHKAQVPSSGSNSSNSTDQPGATSSAEMLSHSANQDMGASSQSDADNEPVDKALRPEVKMEDVLVKEEPAGWFPETEEGLDSLQFSEADTGLAYAPQQTTFRSGCLPWELAAAAATQAHVLDSQLPHGLPGPSRMQGMDNYLQPEELQQGTCYQILSNEDCSRAREKARRKRHYERQKLKHNTDKDYREKMRRKWRERKARQRSKGDKSREHHSKDTGIRESLYYASPKVELYQV